MVDVGNVRIKGTINTSDIERGFTRLELSLDSVKGKSKGFTSDLQRMSAISFALANNLIAVGKSAVGGIFSNIWTAIWDSPALADEMARWEVATDRMGRAIGEDIEAGVDVAITAYEKLVSFIEGRKIKTSEEDLITTTPAERLEAIMIETASVTWDNQLPHLEQTSSTKWGTPIPPEAQNEIDLFKELHDNEKADENKKTQMLVNTTVKYKW